MSGIDVGMLVVVLLGPAAGGSGEDPARDELARHQGVWSVVRFEREGKVSTEDVLATITRVVEGDHVVWKREGKSFAGTRMVLDPAREPAAIDLIPDGGPNRGQKVLGIYRFEADGRLVLCVADAGEPRPEAFTSPEGSKRTLQVLRHARP